MTDAFSAIASQDYETLLGDSYADPALELAYLRQVVAQHVAHSFRVEAENVTLRQAARPELIADLVVAKVEKYTDARIDQRLAAAVEGVNATVFQPRAERNNATLAEVRELRKLVLKLEGRVQLLIGELGLRATIEKWAA